MAVSGLAGLLGRGLAISTLWSWRNRRLLVPHLASLIVLLAGSLGHRFASGLPFAAIVGAGVAGGIWLLAARLRLPTRRAYARAVGFSVAGWLIVTMAHGVDRPALFALLAAGTLLAIPWWWHWRIRAGVEIDWVDLDALWAQGLAEFLRRAPGEVLADLGRLFRALFELRRYRRDWPITTYQAGGGLLNSTLVSGRFLPHLVVLGVDLEGGRHVDQIEIPKLESALDVQEHGRVRVKGSGGSASVRRCSIEIVRDTAPLPARLPWKGGEEMERSAFTPIPIGEFAGGRPVRLRLIDRGGENHGKVTSHIAIGGMTGYGKSSLVRRLMDHLSTCPDVEVYGLDPKGGVDMHFWGPTMAVLETDARQATPLFRRVQAEIEERRRELVRRGDDNWMQREGDRLLVLLVDELATLPAEAKRLLDDIVRMGRATGVLVIALTQRWSADSTGREGTGDTRSQFDTKISFRVERPKDGEMLFGEGSGRTGWRPDRLTIRGRALIHSTPMGLLTPEPFQAYWQEGGRAVRDLVARRLAGHPGPAADARPDAPALPAPTPPLELRVVGGRRDDPRSRLADALARAGRTGARVDELAREADLSDSRAYVYIGELKASGEVMGLARGRYRLTDPSRWLAPQEDAK